MKRLSVALLLLCTANIGNANTLAIECEDDSGKLYRITMIKDGELADLYETYAFMKGKPSEFDRSFTSVPISWTPSALTVKWSREEAGTFWKMTLVTNRKTMAFSLNSTATAKYSGTDHFSNEGMCKKVEIDTSDNVF